MFCSSQINYNPFLLGDLSIFLDMQFTYILTFLKSQIIIVLMKMLMNDEIHFLSANICPPLTYSFVSKPTNDLLSSKSSNSFNNSTSRIKINASIIIQSNKPNYIACKFAITSLVCFFNKLSSMCDETIST